MAFFPLLLLLFFLQLLLLLLFFPAACCGGVVDDIFAVLLLLLAYFLLFYDYCRCFCQLPPLLLLLLLVAAPAVAVTNKVEHTPPRVSARLHDQPFFTSSCSSVADALHGRSSNSWRAVNVAVANDADLATFRQRKNPRPPPPSPPIWQYYLVPR